MSDSIAARSKGYKQVTDAEFEYICSLFDKHSRTRAVKLARPIISGRKDQTIYQTGRDLGLKNGLQLKAIAVDGFSIVSTTHYTQAEIDEWMAKR